MTTQYFSKLNPDYEIGNELFSEDTWEYVRYPDGSFNKGPLWIKHLTEHGWCVIPSIFNEKYCNEKINEIWTWLEEFETGIKRTNPFSWYKDDAWPHNLHGIIQQFGVGHNKFNWEVRQSKEMIRIFEIIYRTDKLSTSFDGISVVRPPKLGSEYSKKDWFHTDQGSSRKGFQCIQGFLNLTKSYYGSSGLTVIDYSHIDHDNFFIRNNIETKTDFYKATDEIKQNDQLFKNGNRITILPSVGDVVLFDSRTWHYGKESNLSNIWTELNETNKNEIYKFCRTVIFVSMRPTEKLASDKKRGNIKEIRKKLFHDGRTTNHWGTTPFSLSWKTYGKSSQFMKHKKRKTPLLHLNINEYGMKLI